MNPSLSITEFSERAQRFPLEELETLVAILQRTIRQQRQLPLRPAVLETHPQDHDPLDTIIGMVNSQLPDWADQHDDYLGQAITRKWHSTPEE